MFTLIEPHEPCEWPVRVPVPQHGGRTLRQGFTARFKWVDSDRFSTLAAQGDEALLADVLVGWGEDLKDEAGEPLAFSSEARARLVRITYVRRALVTAYGEFISGRAAGN